MWGMKKGRARTIVWRRCAVVFLAPCLGLASLGGAVPVASARPPAPEVVGPGSPGGPDRPDGPKRTRRLLWSGAALGSLGLVTAGVGFGIFAGVHAANPGAGLSLEGPDAGRALRVARAGAAVGYTGLALAAAGGVAALVGALRLRAGRRAARRRVALVPGPRGVVFTGRF